MVVAFASARMQRAKRPSLLRFGIVKQTKSCFKIGGQDWRKEHMHALQGTTRSPFLQSEQPFLHVQTSSLTQRTSVNLTYGSPGPSTDVRRARRDGTLWSHVHPLGDTNDTDNGHFPFPYNCSDECRSMTLSVGSWSNAATELSRKPAGTACDTVIPSFQSRQVGREMRLASSWRYSTTVALFGARIS